MKTDLTGLNQHGFKKGSSTLTSGLVIQTALAKALDHGNFVLLASLDLSSAFDVVNIALLIKRWTKIGIFKNVVDLIKIWLNERSYYIRVEGSFLEIFWNLISKGVF